MVKPNNANRKTYRTLIFFGIGGIVPVNAFDPKSLGKYKEHVRKKQQIKRTKNAMKTKKRKHDASASKIQQAKKKLHAPHARWNRRDGPCESIVVQISISRVRFFEIAQMKHRETQKHSESKHRVRIREADKRWDGSGERVEVEIASTIRKERRVSAIMKKPGNIRTNERNTEISSIQPKTIQNRNPAIFTKHGELSNYRVWRFGTPSNDGMDPVKLLFESELQRQRNSNRTK
jgi:hypothetical protein